MKRQERLGYIFGLVMVSMVGGMTALILILAVLS